MVGFTVSPVTVLAANQHQRNVAQMFLSREVNARSAETGAAVIRSRTTS
ncbi:hypothetical protein [Roseateles sp. MS654]